MFDKNFRAGETHYFSYTLAHIRFVAMDCTFRARSFFLAERAFAQTLFGVVEHVGAVRT